MGSYIEDSIVGDEVVVALFPLHWVAWIKVWVAYGSVIGIPFAAFWHWSLRNVENGVTDQRVIQKTGIIARSTDEMLLESIETVTLNQSAWGRVLGYGTVIVTGKTAGVSDVEMTLINKPLAVKKIIEEARFQARRQASSPSFDTSSEA